MPNIRSTSVVFTLLFASITSTASAQTQNCQSNGTCLPAISSLFTNLTPASLSASDGVPYELGTVFTPASDGTVTQVRFFKSAQESGQHVGHIWSYDDQKLLATVTFRTETGAGWQSATLAPPLWLKAGTRYVVTVNSNSYFTSTLGGLTNTITSGYLSTVADVDNGLFGAPGAFPVKSFQHSNYFVDVTFRVADSLLTALTPAFAEVSDSTPYELGMRFVPNAPGSISGIRFWNTASEQGTHVGRLWTDAGKLLSTVTFSGEAGTGWRSVLLRNPVPVKAGTTYVVTVNTNNFFADTRGGLAAPGLSTQWLHSVADGHNGVFGAPGKFPTQDYLASNYFRDVIFQPVAGLQTKLQPWHHRGYLGWIRDLASKPSPTNAYWPDITIDAQLVADYNAAGLQISRTGATEIEIWGLAAAGNGASPGYLPNVEATASPARVALVKQIIANLHRRKLKVVAGMGGMSWGFDLIVQANPSIGCSNSGLLANPLQPLSWSYQERIIDYLMSFGVDGITVQSGDQGICAEGNPDGLDPVQYHAPIVDRIASYIRQKYPNAIIGSANYGIPFNNPADLEALKLYTSHLDYVVDVGDTARSVGGGYRARLAAAIAPAELGQEADPNPGAPVHFDRLSWFLPTYQHDIANLQALYNDGGRSAENYMRMQANPGDEVTTELILMYEAKPGSNLAANLDAVLKRLYKPADAAALAQLRDLFNTAETAYFSNAYSENSLVEAYYNFGDRGRPYLRDNMSASGRAAYRAALVDLLAKAQAVQPNVGSVARVNNIITCIQAVIAQIDAI